MCFWVSASSEFRAVQRQRCCKVWRQESTAWPQQDAIAFHIHRCGVCSSSVGRAGLWSSVSIPVFMIRNLKCMIIFLLLLLFLTDLEAEWGEKLQSKWSPHQELFLFTQEKASLQYNFWELLPRFEHCSEGVKGGLSWFDLQALLVSCKLWPARDFAPQWCLVMPLLALHCKLLGFKP